MPSGVPYVFCRYRLTVDDRSLSGREQLKLLEEVRGTTVPHRKSDPDDGDEDTFAMRPKQRTTSGEPFLTWDVGYNVRVRRSARYDRTGDDLSVNLLADDGIRYTSFVAVPRFGVCAISDRLSDIHIGAKPGISRFKSVIKHGVRGGYADIELAASQADAHRALSEWSLSKFTFTVRPFNPHPRDPGRKLSELFDRDGIGRLSGTAVPMPGKVMRMADDGYIEETLGLAETGYGQFGVEGTTTEGREASLKKPQFSLETKANQRRQAQPHLLRVYIGPYDNEGRDQLEAARALIDFYGD